MAILSTMIGSLTAEIEAADATATTIYQNFLKAHYSDLNIDDYTNQQQMDAVLALLVEFLVDGHRAYLRDEAARAAAEAALESAEGWE